MAIKEIVRKGHPALKAKSTAVVKTDDRIKELIQNLKDTLYSTPNGIGLAAPQIGFNKRVIFIDLRDGMEPILLINPRIVSHSGTQESEESCLSLPGYYGYVERPAKVIVKGLNERGEEVQYKGEELLCRAFCHEIDHLNGIMFSDKAYELYRDDEERK